MLGTGAEPDLSSRSARLWLALVMLVATGLRLWGLDYGLPHSLTRPDEERVVGAAMSIARGNSLHPGDFMYPGLMKYVAGGVLSAGFHLGRELGWYRGFDDFVDDLTVARPARHFLICRAVSAFFGVLTVFVTYALAARLSGARLVGLLAAWLVAVCYLHARDSHFATVDVTATFFATLTLFFAAGFAGRGGARDLLAAAFSAGLAAGSKYNVGLVAVAVVVACWRAPGAETWRVRLRWVALAGGVAMAGFALAAPYSLLKYRETAEVLEYVKGKLMAGEGPPALVVHLRESFPGGMGWPFFLAALFGLLQAVRRRRDGDLVLLAFLGVFFASIAPVRWVVPRYVIPLLPALSALASAACLAPFGRNRPRAAVALAALLGAPTLYATVSYDRLASRPDTRLLAARWVEANLIPERGIGVCRGYGGPEINGNSDRGPWFRVKQVPCNPSALAQLTRPYLVTHEHPKLPWSFPLGAFDRLTQDRWRKIAVFDPFVGGSGGTAVYSTGDAFFMPYSGLDTVTRGGPVITVWERSPSR